MTRFDQLTMDSGQLLDEDNNGGKEKKIGVRIVKPNTYN